MSVASFEALVAVEGLTVRREEPLSRHGSLRLGGAVELYAVAHTERALRDAYRLARTARLRLRVVCGLTDLAARDEGCEGLVVRLGAAFTQITLQRGRVTAGVGAALARLGVVAHRAQLAGFEPLEVLSGTVGEWITEGGLGACGEAIESVRVLSGRGVRDVPRADLEQIPKRAIPLAITLSEGLPMIPKGPPPRGSLLVPDHRLVKQMDRAGLLGLRLRQLRLSDDCPGVVVNLGEAVPRDLELLRVLVRDRLTKELDEPPRLRLDLSSPFRSAALRIGTST
jgi:UDP-N-acetylenolpyruvoylglucosamine reductase